MKYLKYVATMIIASFTIVGSSINSTEQTNQNESQENVINVIEDALKLLSSTPTGARIIAEARAALSSHKSLTDVIKFPSPESAIGASIEFNPENPEQSLVEYTIYIKQYENSFEVILALAHELTHFTYANLPYLFSSTSPMNASEYIVRQIEGQGGEVDAKLAECQILRELPLMFTTDFCQSSTDEMGNLDRERAVKLFYKIGPYYDIFVEDLQRKYPTLDISAALPHLSSETTFLPPLISSYEQYWQQKHRACSMYQEFLQTMDPASQGHTRIRALFDTHCVESSQL